jgi:C-terminal processing protease CtpA/Prc
MKTKFLLAAFVVLSANVFSQLNLHFEQRNPDGSLVKWGARATDSVINGYRCAIDSVVKYEGRYAVMLKSTDARNEGTFGARAAAIDAVYAGKTITLKGFIKTENVEGGFAGLWIRIDGDGGRVFGFNNMSEQELAGTNDWKEYSITVDLDPEGKKIVYGFLLTGTGSMWVDKLGIVIDDKPIEQTPAKEMKQDAAGSNEFLQGSGFDAKKITAGQAAALATLGRVWGFLKYYHPAVAAGNYNWDHELFRILPAYNAAKNKDERNQVMKDWINKLGAVAACDNCSDEMPAAAFLKPANGWLKDNNVFTEEVMQLLEHIRKNRYQGAGYYIDMEKGIGNPKIKNEKEYAAMIKPDLGYRMLSLYRYWNMVQYWFPYRHLIDGGWDKVLNEFVPVFAAAADSVSYRLAALQLIARINDTHANIWGQEKILNEYKGDYTAPYSVRFIDGKAVITGSYNDALTTGKGIAKGDIIEKINGKKIADIIKEKLPFTPGSNYPVQLRDIAANLLRSVSSNIDVALNQGGETKTYSIACYRGNTFKRETDWDNSYFKDSSYTMLPGNIGYVTLGKIKNTQWEDIFQTFKDTKGLIIDIRNYPSDFVVFAATPFLLAAPTEFVRFTHGHLKYPGLFTMETAPLKVGMKNKNPYKGKLVILVNELSQSQSEYTAMALRATPGAVVLGSTTAGADGNVSRFSLPGGITTMFSGIGVYYPDGRETQRVGIVPDVEVKPTIKGIKEGRDELMEKAAEIINALN